MTESGDIDEGGGRSDGVNVGGYGGVYGSYGGDGGGPQFLWLN